MRSHPELKVDEKLFSLNHIIYQNIELDFNTDVESTYQQTHIAVSQFSSCLVESIAFGCIPLMFNPTYGFDYPLLPDTHISRDEKELMIMLKHLVNSRKSVNTPNSIIDSDINCIRNITSFINTII